MLDSIKKFLPILSLIFSTLSILALLACAGLTLIFFNSIENIVYENINKLSESSNSIKNQLKESENMTTNAESFASNLSSALENYAQFSASTSESFKKISNLLGISEISEASKNLENASARFSDAARNINQTKESISKIRMEIKKLENLLEEQDFGMLETKIRQSFFFLYSGILIFFFVILFGLFSVFSISLYLYLKKE